MDIIQGDYARVEERVEHSDKNQGYPGHGIRNRAAIIAD